VAELGEDGDGASERGEREAGRGTESGESREHGEALRLYIARGGRGKYGRGTGGAQWWPAMMAIMAAAVSDGRSGGASGE
jgi:hypothetical protein